MQKSQNILLLAPCRIAYMCSSVSTQAHMHLHLWVQEHLNQHVIVDVRGQPQVSAFSSAFSETVSWLLLHMYARLAGLWRWCLLTGPLGLQRHLTAATIHIGVWGIQFSCSQLHLQLFSNWATSSALTSEYSHFLNKSILFESLIFFFSWPVKLFLVSGNDWDTNSLSGLRPCACLITGTVLFCAAVYVVSCRCYYFNTTLE